VEIPHLALGNAQTRQLIRLLDAARAEGSASVIVSCGDFVIELSFDGGRVIAETARDASKVGEADLSIEDEAVLLILGWRRDTAHSPFGREWHPKTASEDIADDVVRAARHAYQCDADAMQVLLRVREPQEATSLT
jgi:hypothetical protein